MPKITTAERSRHVTFDEALYPLVPEDGARYEIKEPVILNNIPQATLMHARNQRNEKIAMRDINGKGTELNSSNLDGIVVENKPHKSPTKTQMRTRQPHRSPHRRSEDTFKGRESPRVLRLPNRPGHMMMTTRQTEWYRTVNRTRNGVDPRTLK